MPSTKQQLIALGVSALQDEVEALRRAADTTRAGAVHEEAKPENDKDTRALEQSYLARGQAQRVVQAEEALKRLRFCPVVDFDATTPIAVSALIQLEVDGAAQWVFLVTAGGGLKLDLDGRSVQLVTPEAPLGRALVGKLVGEGFELRLAGALREYEVLSVA